MTQDEIVEMTRQAGGFDATPKFLEAFAKLVAQHEREACANLRKEVALLGKRSTEYEDGFWDGLEKYEELIRARGKYDTR
jgi:hypothetical protein